jgi:hypothetical protein
MKVFWAILAVLNAFVSLSSADEIPVSRFSVEGLSGWESMSFKGVTEYLLVKEDGRTVVKASSHDSASGMIRKRFILQSAVLRWRWKIADTIKNGDETEEWR